MKTHVENEPLVGLTTGRLEALCDGILAISMTLLVLTFPDIRDVGAAGSIAEALRRFKELGPHLLAYLMSFLLVSVYWLLHHIMFHYIRRADRVLLWLNMMFLMFVAFVPFSTGLLAECIRNEFSLVVIAYGAAHLVTGLWLAAIWGYATRHRRLVASDLEGWVVHAVMRSVLTGPVLYTVGIVIACFSWSAALILYLIVPVCYLLPSRVDHHWIILGRPLPGSRPAVDMKADGRAA